MRKKIEFTKKTKQNSDDDVSQSDHIWNNWIYENENKAKKMMMINNKNFQTKTKTHTLAMSVKIKSQISYSWISEKNEWILSFNFGKNIYTQKWIEWWLVTTTKKLREIEREREKLTTTTTTTILKQTEFQAS